ncbi:putative receptor-like protein kinase At4g00960 isoform X1 [Dendrobium catenatum]|uniref:putative receptor-like protein kinase At4g00960 isoform X1 n=1 Tax=Dendrobium catenatum TaxID=906689 RepID=UPI0009F3E6C6|nr:putative receptor-like protein kinase At4g00960 isoform X1 [Dendrobium catenatum]
MALPYSFLLSLQILLFLVTGTRSEDIIFTSCGNTNYNAGSAYESNLRSLITKLTEYTWNSSLYSTTTIGSSPDAQVFGLAQCRPDVSAATCIDCLNSSATAAVGAKGCPQSKSAAFRADHCVLRYSDQRFFSIPETSKILPLANIENASNPVVFKQTVNALMGKISPEASTAESRFGEGNANYSELKDIYGMAWCTQDLSSSDCQQCLDGMAGMLPVDKVGGQVMTVSCITRFETYSFLSVLPPPSTAEVPPRPSPAAVEGGNSGNGKDGQSKGNNTNTTKKILIIVLPVSVVFTLLSVFLILQSTKRRAPKRLRTSHFVEKENIRSTESLLFDMDTIRKATNDFSEENKLGEGGFGPVYKGLLEDGQHIAVKRLSRTSTQGFVEMKNEVALVAKLQHKNLVRLLGCCLEENEKILVYEYLPKTSLDKYLFDSTERPQFDWGTRYKIIEGIGRGLLYLHEDSRLKIIHRDLKASNILLDNSMRPKISDFGLARLFHIDQTQQNTNRIAGTFGYMAPEYAMTGLFSTKSDVFSYGVLILEIITGRRNGIFADIGHHLDLLGYVWKYWNEGTATALQVVDQCLGHEFQPQEVLRCLQIGLLCVQEDSLLRPSMNSVMVMISSHSTTIPIPSTPPFYMTGRDSDSSVQKSEQNVYEKENLRAVSANSVTITDLEAR